MSNDRNDTDRKKPKPPNRAGLRLPADAQPTKSLLTHEEWVRQIKKDRRSVDSSHEQEPGPFFREFAPYRAKLAPPYEVGTVLVIKGRVWSYEEKKPLPATMDVWQADHKGLYDNEKHGRPASEQTFINRARIRCDENGYYEFETVHPGPYKRGEIQRAPHIHFRIEYPTHVTCVTQLLFRGDPHLDEDPFVEGSEIIDLKEEERNGQKYQEGFFNIVLILKERTPEDAP